MVIGIIALALLLQQAAMAQPAAAPPALPAQESMERLDNGARLCSADHQLCFAVSDGEQPQDRELIVTMIDGDGQPQSQQVLLPAQLQDQDVLMASSIDIWAELIRLGDNAADPMSRHSALIGLIVSESRGYSGGGGQAQQLYLFRLSYGPGTPVIGDEMLRVPLTGSK